MDGRLAADLRSDGRIYLLLPACGNHEAGGNTTVYNLLDTTSNNYYALTFGGDPLRYYVLNSESSEHTENMDGKRSEQHGRCHAFDGGISQPMRLHHDAKGMGAGI